MVYIFSDYRLKPGLYEKEHMSIKIVFVVLNGVGPTRGSDLTWNLRMKIAVDVAR